MRPVFDQAPLLVSKKLAAQLLALYDYPDPTHPGRVIRGYDRPHALRTARMSAAVAAQLGHAPTTLIHYHVASLLHDLGRAGLDRRLFGKIWSWAQAHGIPTRPREWRAMFPETPYGRETEAFIRRNRVALAEAGIPLDAWAQEQIEMRLGYARRFGRLLRTVRPRLSALGIHWAPWMGQVVLYYYYPEKLEQGPDWVKELGEVLVACEQFEALNNRRRGQDYYRRSRESCADACAYLDTLRREGILRDAVVRTLMALASRGAFDAIVSEARGCPLTPHERRTLRQFSGAASCL